MQEQEGMGGGVCVCVSVCVSVCLCVLYAAECSLCAQVSLYMKAILSRYCLTGVSAGCRLLTLSTDL